MAPRCKKGNHNWHFNGIVWTCRAGCGAVKDRDHKMIREPFAVAGTKRSV